jgi:hypothetical protein
MSQAYTLRTSKGSALTHTELDNNFNSQLGTSSGVRFGALGIGVAESTTGTIVASSNITAYSSDERLKTKFTPIADAILKVMQLTGYEYDWNEELCAQVGFPFANKHEHGVKAQEVQKVVPDAVTLAPFDRDEEGASVSGENYLTVDYTRLVPLLIQAVKEQQETIQQQAVKLLDLEQKLNKLVE